MTGNMPLILASASSRRVELLSHLLPKFDKMPADIDESVFEGESPEAYVSRLARQKAETIHKQFPQQAVLGSDTVVVKDNQILGKPCNFAHSKSMLSLLSDGWHQVMTAVNIQFIDDAQEKTSLACLVKTNVEFCRLDEKEITDYWQTFEPQDKAGSYAIQGIGGKFVKQIHGSYSAVVGLPLVETQELLKQIGAIS